MNVSCGVWKDECFLEQTQHGEADFPFRFYLEDVWEFDFHCIDWHWHPEVEFVYTERGSITCFVGTERFILPQGWSYDTFETVVAGEDMDAREWGVHVFIGGDQNLRFTVCGTNETEARTGNSEPFQTGSGLTGKKYVEGTTGEDGQAYWEFCLVFEGIEGGGAEYKIYGGLGQEEYEQYAQALDDFAAGVSIVTVARD